ncbi:hypothetical protein OX283_003015 [Flavobacterium sp. SUN052]|uniref:hypothetical protein n=1 Tax=Flavobacterium sp. SUN052 TaxID=3002441 RepID=UPI00237DB3FE|nr:hypothetical protein [Flavobacterium sp. SUN052]MEC4003618.1 hypothetical protein [Flavobacterium sp. SUN052]
MKFRILFDNYYSYILIFGGLSILSYFLLDKKISYRTYFILGLLWLTDLIFEQKKYLKSIEISENNLELTYLNVFLIEKKYTIENKLVEYTEYKKSTKSFNKFDFLFIKEKSESHLTKFKILENVLKETVKKKITFFENKSY